MTATGVAPGKVLLVGEHGVVHGGVAFALPFPAVEARAELRAEPGPLRLESPIWSGILDADTPPPAAGLAAAALATFALLDRPATGWVAHLEASIPLGAGLGSSAATAAALVRGILLAHGRVPGDEVDALVHLAEQAAHGTPSGVDGRVITVGQPIAFRRGETLDETQLVPTGAVFNLVVGYTGVTRRTQVAVARVTAFKDNEPVAAHAAMEAIKALAWEAIAAWRAGDAVAVGTCLDGAQAQLERLGVSTPELETLIRAARDAGALGAKLTGAGMGGCMLALARDATHADELVRALAGAATVWKQEYRP
ncbi:MAG: mevalonate kinase [Cyanobacteria bacterium RYN_339]|nr:mevalonate kinase [Cyanobacteria bacterium RYN_339]